MSPTLAGAPEDHSGRLFQGVEGHPHPHPARTFSRIELERLFTEAGLVPATLGVFPDYRFARLVFSSALADGGARPLLWRVPSFPTPRHPSYEPAHVLDERRVWRGFVENGWGLDFANSHLVIAGRDGEPSLWPEGQAGVFFSSGRQRSLAIESRILKHDGGWLIRTKRLAPSEPVPATLIQCDVDERYVEGEALLRVLSDADDGALRRWLRAMVAVIDEHTAGAQGRIAFDAWPGNMIVSGDGNLTVVDHELSHTQMTSAQVRDRAFLLTALELPQRTLPERWAARTHRELVDELRASAGLGPMDIDAAVEVQAQLLADVTTPQEPAVSHRRAYEQARELLLHQLDRPLADVSVHGTARDAGAQLHLRVAGLEDALSQTRAELERVRAGLAGAQGALDAVRRSKSWRLTAPMRRVAGRARRLSQ